MSYSLVSIRTRQNDGVEYLARTFDFDVLREGEDPLQFQGIIPDDQIDPARKQGFEIRILKRTSRA